MSQCEVVFLQQSQLFLSGEQLSMGGDHFNGLLASEVLDVKPQHEHTGKVLVDLALQARVIMRRMAKSQPAQCRQPLGIILNDVD